MDLTKLYNTIIKINLFKGFNINEIENLLKKIRFQIKSYKKNESIFFRGDPIKHIIILIITDLLLKSKIKQGYSKIAGHTLCTPVFWNDIPAY